MASALRSLAFALFQIIVTPLYALSVMLLAWLPRVPRYRYITFWCAMNLWAARWICGIRSRLQAQLDVGDAVPVALPPAPRVRSEEGTVVIAVLRVGVPARLADHH